MWHIIARARDVKGLRQGSFVPLGQALSCFVEEAEGALKEGALNQSWVVMAACAGLSVAAGLPAFAGSSPPGVVVTSATAGLVDPNGVVPNFNAAQGAGTPTWDVAIPRGILRIGGTYVYSMTMQNTTYSGKCTASYTLTQVQNGVTVTLESGVYQTKFACAAGNLFGWVLYGAPIPNSSGEAKLTATVAYGKKKTSLSVPLLIEP